MAIITVSNTGGNWNTTTAWVGGVVPTSVDDVIFTATSGNITVNTNTCTCKSIDFTNYVNTITIINNAILIVNGNVTLNTGHTNACVGSGRMVVQALSSLTSNTKAWTGALYFLGTSVNKTFIDSWNIGTLVLNDTSSTTTLNADITVTNFTINNNNSAVNTMNGNKIYVTGSFSEGTTVVKTGTTEIVLSGTGTWSNTSTGFLSMPLTIDTLGTITLGSFVYYHNSTFKYVKGIVVTTGNRLTSQATTSWDSAGILWNDVVINGGPQTYVTPFTVNGTWSTSNPNVYNGANLIINGNMVINQAPSGTSTILYSGTGTWSGAVVINNTLIINTMGTLTLVGTVIPGNATYITGKVVTKNAILQLPSCTLINFNKIVFERITINAGSTVVMNEFFSGSPTVKTRITSSSTTNYSITFQDKFEKITKFVEMSNATITNRMQLLSLTTVKNKNTNIGIRYINQSPNSIPKNSPSVLNKINYGSPNFLVSDPAMTAN